MFDIGQKMSLGSSQLWLSGDFWIYYYNLNQKRGLISEI